MQPSMSMSTVYTSGGPQVGLAIAQPADTPHRELVGVGWMCELRGDGVGKYKCWRADKLKKAFIHFHTVCFCVYLCMQCVCMNVCMNCIECIT